MLMPYSIATYADWKTIQLFTVRLHVQNSTSIRKVSAINEIQPSKNLKIYKCFKLMNEYSH